MDKKLQDFLKNLETKLMNASNREEAYNLIVNYDKQSLEVIQNYLKAFTKSKSRDAIVDSIVRVTFDAMHRHRVITNQKLK